MMIDKNMIKTITKDDITINVNICRYYLKILWKLTKASLLIFVFFIII